MSEHKDSDGRTSTDLVQAQTKARIEREKETYLQQQARLMREHRRDIWFVAVIAFVVVLLVIGRAWLGGGR